MSKPDWEAIESAYRTGLLSLRAIGEKHGVNTPPSSRELTKKGGSVTIMGRTIKGAPQVRLIMSG